VWRVQLGCTFSEVFCLLHGVRQGGELSLLCILTISLLVSRVYKSNCWFRDVLCPHVHNIICWWHYYHWCHQL